MTIHQINPIRLSTVYYREEKKKKLIIQHEGKSHFIEFLPIILRTIEMGTISNSQWFGDDSC